MISMQDEHLHACPNTGESRPATRTPARWSIADTTAGRVVLGRKYGPKALTQARRVLTRVPWKQELRNSSIGAQLNYFAEEPADADRPKI